MSVTNKKTDTLRRLFLGPLYGECKDNPMGVSKQQLQERLNKLVSDGCVLDCSVDEMVKTCQLKSHYPLCAKDRECIEKTWPNQRGIDKLSYQQYNTSKMFENEPDTDEEEDEEECNICMMDEDEDGNHIKEMSCGHKSHVSCLIKVAQQKGVDNAECPECRKVFSLSEVPVPVRNMEQRMIDSSRRTRFNASQMGFEVPNLERDEREAVRLREEARLREREREQRGREREERDIEREQREREEREREQQLNENFTNILNQLRPMINLDRIFEENEIEEIRQLIINLRNVAVTRRELDIASNYVSRLRSIVNSRQEFLERQERIRRQQEREERRQQEREEARLQAQERRQQETEEVGQQSRTRSGRVSRRRQ